MNTRISINFYVDNVKDGIGNLRMRVRWSGNTVAVNLGYKIVANKWDTEEQKCKANTSHFKGKEYVLASVVNKDIRRHRDYAESVFDNNPLSSLDKDTFRSCLRSALGRREELNGDLLIPTMRTYVLRQTLLGAISKGTADVYMNSIRKLDSMRSGLRTTDISEKLLEDYAEYLVLQGLSNRFIKQMSTVLKSILKGCGYRLDYTPHLRTLPHTIVWLRWEELMMFYRADLSGYDGWLMTDIEAVRDMFCFSCFTGFRYSDIQGLRRADIKDGKISRKIQKTSASVQVELNKYSREILSRYNGTDKIFPSIPNNSANYALGRIAKYIGLDEPISISYYKGGTRHDEVKPKWSVLSMHCGRRTFICNALSKGISPNIVMRWTGHSSYEDLRPYIDIADSAKENAMLVFEG